MTALILEAQKHMDPTDPDTQHTGEICQLALRLILKGKKVVKKFSRFQVTRHNVNFGNVKFWYLKHFSQLFDNSNLCSPPLPPSPTYTPFSRHGNKEQLGESVLSKSIEWFIEDQASSPSYNLTPPLPPLPPPRQQVVSFSQSFCVSPVKGEEPNNTRGRKTGPL